MKKVKIQINESIDWSKPQWVQSVAYPDLIVLTSGCSSLGAYFTGTAMPCHIHPKGEYRNDWCKSGFKSLTFDIPFTISNSNE